MRSSSSGIGMITYLGDSSLDLREDIIRHRLREVDSSYLGRKSGMEFEKLQLLLVRHSGFYQRYLRPLWLANPDG